MLGHKAWNNLDGVLIHYRAHKHMNIHSHWGIWKCQLASSIQTQGGNQTLDTWRCDSVNHYAVIKGTIRL